MTETAHNDDKLTDTRKGLCGAQHPARKTNAVIFPEQPQKHTLITDNAFLEKLKSGAPLTSEERKEALYHPNLFNQARTAPTEQAMKPWEVCREKIPFRASRKLVEASCRASTAPDASEAATSSGKKMVKQASPQKEAPERYSRKHVSPRKSSGEAEWFKSPKKRVEGVRQASIDLTFDSKNQVDAKQKYSRKQVADVRASLVNLKLDDPVPADNAADHARPLRKLRPSECKSTADSCPYGTDYSHQEVKPNPSVSNTYRSNIDLKVGGSSSSSAAGERPSRVAIPARAKDHYNILTWK